MIHYAALQNLVGLKIIMASHAASLRGFIFGPPGEESPGALRWIVHIQCPWRIDSQEGIITGSGDWYEPADSSSEQGDDWDPAEGDSLQAVRLRELFDDQDLSKGTISNNTNSLVCTEFKVDSHGDVTIRLTDGYTLRLFPAASWGEHWRIFPDSETGAHVVCKAPGPILR